MAVLNAQTREEIRVSVGRNLRAVRTSTMTANGSTTTFVDSTLENADDYANGRWFLGTSGSNDGAERIVDDYVGSTTTGTIRGDALTSTADGDTYELWDEDIRPTDVHDHINQAIRSITRRGAPPVRDISLHTSHFQRVFTIPTNVVGISSVEYREWHRYLNLELCNSAWSELVDADVTASADTEDKREGAASARFDIAAGLAAGDIIATNAIGPYDISRYTHLEGWFKSTVAVTAGQLQLLLDDTAQCASPLESTDLPAADADTWTRLRFALANPELDTAIISVGIKDTADIGAATVWLDGIKAVKDGDEYWKLIHRNHWSVDKDGRLLRLKPEAAAAAPYNLLLLRGSQKPSLLTTDSDVCDVEPEFVIARATAAILRATGDRRAGDRDAAWVEAERWEALATRALTRSAVPKSTAWVDN